FARTAPHGADAQIGESMSRTSDSFTRTAPQRVGWRISEGEPMNITNSSKLTRDQATTSTASRGEDLEDKMIKIEEGEKVDFDTVAHLMETYVRRYRIGQRLRADEAPLEMIVDHGQAVIEAQIALEEIGIDLCNLKVDGPKELVITKHLVWSYC